MDARFPERYARRVMWHFHGVPLKRPKDSQIARAGYRGQERRDAFLVNLVARLGPLQAVGTDDEVADVLCDIEALDTASREKVVVFVSFELDGGKGRRAVCGWPWQYCGSQRH